MNVYFRITEMFLGYMHETMSFIILRVTIQTY